MTYVCAAASAGKRCGSGPAPRSSSWRRERNAMQAYISYKKARDNEHRLLRKLFGKKSTRQP